MKEKYIKLAVLTAVLGSQTLLADEAADQFTYPGKLFSKYRS